jgi:hypothetical protein
VNRWLLILAVALLAVAAGRMHLFHVPLDQITVNRLEWNDLDEPARDALRADWRRVRATTGDEHGMLVQRMETLSRMLVSHRRRSNEKLATADLERELAGLETRVSDWLPGPPQAGQGAGERVTRRTTRLLNRFLENLSGAGRLDPEERDRLLGLPYDERVLAGLEIQKQEEIFFLAETDGTHDLDELAGIEPLAVVADAWDQRRRRGFLGRAGEVLGLTPEELAPLADAADEELVRMLRALLTPKVRRHLEHRKVEPQRIEEILTKPYRELERILDDLERDLR